MQWKARRMFSENTKKIISGWPSGILFSVCVSLCSHSNSWMYRRTSAKLNQDTEVPRGFVEIAAGQRRKPLLLEEGRKIHSLPGLWVQLSGQPMTAEHYPAGNLNAVWESGKKLYALWGVIDGARECWGGAVWSSQGLWEGGRLQWGTRHNPTLNPTLARLLAETEGKGLPVSTHHLPDFCCDDPIPVGFSPKKQWMKSENSVAMLLSLSESQALLCWVWLFRPSLQIQEKKYSLIYLFLQVTYQHAPYVGLT